MKSGHDYNYFDILRSLKKIKVKKMQLYLLPQV